MFSGASGKPRFLRFGVPPVEMIFGARLGLLEIPCVVSKNSCVAGQPSKWIEHQPPNSKPRINVVLIFARAGFIWCYNFSTLLSGVTFDNNNPRPTCSTSCLSVGI